MMMSGIVYGKQKLEAIFNFDKEKVNDFTAVFFKSHIVQALRSLPHKACN